jgi:hypothetical protein
MKVAIALIGNIRTWNECKENFIEIFSPLNPDIYISTYDLQYDHHPYIKGVINDNEDAILSNEEIHQMFSDLNVKNLEIECSKEVTGEIKLHDIFVQTGVSFSQYRKFQNTMKKIAESGIDYDCIIKTRCDIIHNPISFEGIDLKTSILIDSGNVFPNDCFFATNQESMKNVADFIIHELETPSQPDSHVAPPHNLFKNAIINAGLNAYVQKIMNHVIRKNGVKFYY